MELIQHFFDLFVHLDDHLHAIIRDFGGWTYVLLFLVIFCETGLVVTPFLPGDSLLFATGALAASGSLNATALFLLLCAAAILGDTINYRLGALFGARAEAGRFRFVKAQHLERTREFYARHGSKTIVLARFLPIVRTYAPFIAGASRMDYRRFVLFNVTGALLWISLFLIGGYLFGNVPAVQENFGFVVIAIIALSAVPVTVGFLSSRGAAAKRA
ncbi:MAG TPA: DedA family protein [Longimicrobiaceae bacterium]|nr:DedA family protein [Longimicrobiaceae bacterium]